DLMHLEEEPFPPERCGPPDGCRNRIAGPWRRDGPVCRGGAQGARRVGGRGVRVRRMHGQQRRAARLDEVHVGEPSPRAWRGLARRPREPFDRGDGRVVLERGDRERRERVAKGQRQATGRHGGPPSRAPVPCKRRPEYASKPGVVRGVYTSLVNVRHHELDGFGRVHPGVYLRYLAHAAVEASTAAGFDAAWYAAAGAVWLVRRSTFTVLRPATAGEELEIRTWVEDRWRVWCPTGPSPCWPAVISSTVSRHATGIGSRPPPGLRRSPTPWTFTSTSRGPATGDPLSERARGGGGSIR